MQPCYIHSVLSVIFTHRFAIFTETVLSFSFLLFQYFCYFNIQFRWSGFRKAQAVVKPESSEKVVQLSVGVIDEEKQTLVC